MPIRTLWLPASELQSSASRRLIQIFANRQPGARPVRRSNPPSGRDVARPDDALALSGGVVKSLPVVLGLPSTALKVGDRIWFNSVASEDLPRNGTFRWPSTFPVSLTHLGG